MDGQPTALGMEVGASSTGSWNTDKADEIMFRAPRDDGAIFFVFKRCYDYYNLRTESLVPEELSDSSRVGILGLGCVSPHSAESRPRLLAPVQGPLSYMYGGGAG